MSITITLDRRWVVGAAGVAAAVAIFGSGLAVGATKPPPGTKVAVDQACYKPKTGALFLHKKFAAPSATFACPTGEKPISWTVNGLAGPWVYQGVGHFGSGLKVHEGAHGTLFAETGHLPAGVYSVSASVDLAVTGQVSISCYASVVGVPVDDGQVGALYDYDGPINLTSTISVTDVLTVRSTGDRIGLYCGADGTSDSDYGDITATDLNAVRVTNATRLTLRRG
jgi:hypothetical protein